MASSSAQNDNMVSEREIDTPVAHSIADAVKRSGGPKPAYFIKNIRDDQGNWVTDEAKPNINLITKRLMEVLE